MSTLSSTPSRVSSRRLAAAPDVTVRGRFCDDDDGESVAADKSTPSPMYVLRLPLLSLFWRRLLLLLLLLLLDPTALPTRLCALFLLLLLDPLLLLLFLRWPIFLANLA